MRELLYTVQTRKDFARTVQAVQESSAAHGFRVLHVHDVAATLAEKGFLREPLKIVEICNARFASQVLEKDVRTASFLPCPISIYAQDGQTFVSTMLPTAMADFFPEAGLDEIAHDVEAAVLEIVDEARK